MIYRYNTDLSFDREVSLDEFTAKERGKIRSDLRRYGKCCFHGVRYTQDRLEHYPPDGRKNQRHLRIKSNGIIAFYEGGKTLYNSVKDASKATGVKGRDILLILCGAKVDSNGIFFIRG